MKKVPGLESIALSVSSLLSGIIQKRHYSQTTTKIILEAKAFAERRLEKLIVLLVPFFFWASNLGCKKELATSLPSAPDYFTPAGFPKITFYPVVKCIYSYP
jgi:hypothetical protein